MVQKVKNLKLPPFDFYRTTVVEHLPVRCRLIFQYSREEGLPVKEIARRLHISPKTVENQLGKAVRQLKLAARSLLHSLL